MKTIFRRYLIWLPACLLLTGLFVFSDHAACDVKADESPVLLSVSIDAPDKAVKGTSYDSCFHFNFNRTISSMSDEEKRDLEIKCKVSTSGNITAKKPGKCSIYVYAHNGVNKTINLTVK